MKEYSEVNPESIFKLLKESYTLKCLEDIGEGTPISSVLKKVFDELFPGGRPMDRLDFEMNVLKLALKIDSIEPDIVTYILADEYRLECLQYFTDCTPISTCLNTAYEEIKETNKEIVKSEFDIRILSKVVNKIRG